MRVAMIGGGMISDVHLKALAAHRHVDLACLVEPNPTVREAQAAKYGIARGCADHREVLEDPSIEAVDVAVPHYLHCPITLDALAAGKHVICEKPIGLNLDEADRMIEAAEASSGRLLVKKYLRTCPHHTMARQIIRSGGIGRVYLATGFISVQQRHIENDADNWRGNWEKAGGGMLIDGGVHLIDLMQFMLGRATAVSATAKRLVAEHPEKADDTAAITIEYGDGALANIVCTNVDVALGPMTWEKMFLGTEGALHVFERDGVTRLVKTIAGTSEELVRVENWWERANIDAVTHLIDCLRDGSAPNASLAEARHDLEVALAGYRSAKEGRRIDLARRT